MLRSLLPYTVYLSPEAPSNRLWQTDMRVIWRLSCSQTAMTSYPALAPHSGREWIRASVAFTGGETSKDYSAWWDNLMTTGVYVVLKCICDMAASEIGSERECLLLLLSHCHFLHAVSSFCLLLREGADVCLEHLRVTSSLNISFTPGCSLNHANIFNWVYFQFSILNIVCTTKDRSPAHSNLFLSSFHMPGPLRLFRFIRSKLITLSIVSSLLQLVALNWLHRPAQVESSSLKTHLLF